MDDRERKLTAALYAKSRRVVDYVRQHGRLPEEIPMGGAFIGMNLLIRERGKDLKLSEDEQLVYDAILRSGRTPGGRVVLVPCGDGRASKSAKKVEVQPIRRSKAADRARRERQAQLRRIQVDNMRSFAGRPLTAVFDTAKGQDGEWRVRGSGVFGPPDICRQTAAIVTACEESGIHVLEGGSGSAANASSYTLEAKFLDGGLQAQTGDYMYGKRGASVKGAQAMLFVALTLQLRIQNSLLRRLGLDNVTLEDLKNKLSGSNGMAAPDEGVEIIEPDSGLTEKSAAIAFARAWNRLECSEFLKLLAPDASYASQWVFEELKGRAAISKYLQEKMHTVRESGKKVFAELGRTSSGFSGRDCVFMAQGTKEKITAVALFNIESGLIRHCDLCMPELLGVVRSSVYPI